MNDSNSSTPYCYHCGEPVQDGQSPCPACGKVLDWSRDRGIKIAKEIDAVKKARKERERKGKADG